MSLNFEELCLYPRVGSGVFSRVARRYGICSLPVGPADGTSRLDAESGTLFDALGPLYTAALRAISGKLPELDQLGVGRGIERKWSVLWESGCVLRLATFCHCHLGTDPVAPGTGTDRNS